MTPPNGWEAVLFDLDGTLADTVELILRCFRHTMATHRGEVPPDEAWLENLGRPLRFQIEGFATDAAEADRMLETYVSLQREIHDEMVRPYPGVVAMVEAMRLRGTPIAVVTSKRSGMARRTLASCGLDDAFPVTVGADEVRSGKPDPEPVHLALARLGLEASARVLFVGDSPWDIQAGRAAGTRTAAVLWGPYDPMLLERETPDWLVRRPKELLELRA